MPKTPKAKRAAPATTRKKKVLGRGLDALIPDIGSLDERDPDYFQCNIEMIRPNRYQPRHHFSPEELESLADSIKAQGIIQPLLVRKADTGYELVAGERRLRAARAAGMKQVPVVLKDLSDTQMLEMSIVENIQRENLNPLEEAEAYHRLITEFNLTQDEAAARVGKSRSAVANFLRLRQLPEPVKESLREGLLSMGHARALLGADTPAQLKTAWKQTLARKLSVRETENLVKRLKKQQEAPPPQPEKDSESIYFTSLAEEFSRRLGTKVTIKRHGKRGKMEVEFYDDDDLDRLIAIFKRI